MTIQATDLKLRQSVIMADVPEGGGGPGAGTIAWGESNTIFDDIDQISRTLGNVSIRQLHAHVDTANRDRLLGSYAIVAKGPQDKKVSITLAACETFDRRAQIQTKVANYLIRGTQWGGYVLEDHVKGQRTLQIFQRPGAPVPEAGHTLVLVLDEKKPTEKTQYVRIIKTTVELRTFTAVVGSSAVDYQAAVVTCELQSPLEQDWPGSPPSRMFDSQTSKTLLRTTTAADASNYFGAADLAVGAALGDRVVRVESIYSQLVPSTETEVPMVDAPPTGSAALPVPAAQDVSVSTTQDWSAQIALALPNGILPGSLRIGAGGVSITDKGGILLAGSVQVGTVDYPNGICTLLAGGSYSGKKSITYRPAAYLQRIPQTSEILVTQASRSLSYVGFILPLAQPGTLVISYRAEGRWYVLQDDGSGQLRGIDASMGAGTYNPSTGSYLVSLGALPDVGSSIVLSWGVPTQETVWPAAEVPLYQDLELALPEGASIYPGGLSITWQDGASTKTATAAADMQLTGDATGRVYVGDKRIRFLPNVLPPVGTQINVQVNTAPAAEDSYDAPARGGDGKLQITAAQGGLVPGSVRLRWNTATDVAVVGGPQLLPTDWEVDLSGGGKYIERTQEARDDGVGNLILVSDQSVIGTIDYVTGLATFAPDAVELIPLAKFVRGEESGSPAGNNTGYGLFRKNFAGFEWVQAPSIYSHVYELQPGYQGQMRGWVKLSYYTAASPTQHTQAVPFAPVSDLLPGIVTPIIAGSVLLRTPAGTLASDRLGGLVQYYTNGAWATAGSIDLVTGRIAWSNWERTAPTITRVACTSTAGEALSSVFVFRTAAAPLRPSSLSLQLPAPGGGVQIVTSNAQGQLVGQGVVGTVDYEFGLVRIAFGDMVPKAEIEDEPWYNPSTEDGAGNAWRPNPQIMGSLRYAAVAYSYLPIDGSILGMDPVRLPQDGRVPIFKKGRILILGHNATHGPVTVTDGETVSLGRTRLSHVWVLGSDGQPIATGWEATEDDLDAGQIRVIDTAGWPQPITIEHRVQDMALCTDVQIDGTISLNLPVSHAYPAGSTLSSAVLFGDKFARALPVFDQQSWDGITWADSPVGNVASASYNDAAYPVIVNNAGALTERYALRMRSDTTTFDLIAEHLGQIASGTINADFSPANPFDPSKKLFTLRSAGWGSGWAAGNILRINTVGAMSPMACIRTVQPGQAQSNHYSFDLLTGGDIDRAPHAPTP